MTGFSSVQTPQELEKRSLRRDANYIGFMMLGMTAAMQFTFTALVYFLLSLGVLRPEQVTMDQLGLSNSAFLLLYALVYTFAMAIPPIVVSLICGRRHFPLSPSNKMNAGDAFFGILTSMGICMIANVVVSYIEYFFRSVGVEKPQMPDYLEPTIPSLLLNIAVFALLPALLEELVFRGYVLRALRPYGDWFAVAVSALLFGLMHGNISQIPFALIVGTALGWVYVMTDNIWVPVAVHFANNAFSFLLDYCGDGMSDLAIGKLNGLAIYSIATIGILSLAALIVRRSALFRRLPRKSLLGNGARVVSLLTAPAFVLCVLVFIVLTIMGMVG